jgi:3-deoxy-7-phosphoheptulonate synthase
MSEGNYNVVLCERGVRTFAQHTATRSTSRQFPRCAAFLITVVVDPSHGTGKNYMVIPLRVPVSPSARMG